MDTHFPQFEHIFEYADHISFVAVQRAENKATVFVGEYLRYYIAAVIAIGLKQKYQSIVYGFFVQIQHDSVYCAAVFRGEINGGFYAFVLARLEKELCM